MASSFFGLNVKIYTKIFSFLELWQATYYKKIRESKDNRARITGPRATKRDRAGAAKAMAEVGRDD